MTARRLASVALLFGASLLACANGARSADEPPIARVHRSRCGSCHARVDPGTRTREQFEAAMSRHHDRVRLTDEQWDQMLAYLLGGADSGAPPAR